MKPEFLKFPNSAKLVKNLELFCKRRVLVVGDVGVDEYVSGIVKRISPEAPVPVVEVTQGFSRAGLAANVAQNISSLGGIAVLVSVIGQDSVGESLKSILQSQGVQAQFLIQDPERPTIRKLRIMAQQYHVVRVDFEKRMFLSPEIEAQLLQVVEQNITDCQAVILQDYAKGTLSENLIQKIVALARTQNKIVLADPHRTTPLQYYKNVDMIKPNFDEAVALLGWPSEPIDSNGQNASQWAQKIAYALQEQTHAQKVVITKGSEGIYLLEGKNFSHIPTRARQVFDVSGAGDTVIATLGLSEAANQDLRDGCALANFAASVVVAQLGSVPCSLEELRDLIIYEMGGSTTP